MKGKNSKLYVIGLLAFLLPGCGGGSMGTGVRTLGNAKIDERPTLPKMPRLFFGVSGCDAETFTGKVRFNGETEFGGIKTEEQESGACVFLLPPQSQTLSISSPWFDDVSEIYDSNGQALSVNEGSVQIGPLRWNAIGEQEIVIEKTYHDRVKLKFRKAQ